ncbi:hypothetical protein K1T71_003623 [Dendrolimus kikuchii]|uniref:Uncharacterized protein n=1 Tax=Dendrolimus kikuchii TaxID=765133 RepID=A0ACC1D8Y6_9NEOP|nr:hypothetical protein K1T71_003623 [Dendrolimus kikuchii]
MQDSHRDAIRSNFVSLVERTDLQSMVDVLLEKGVFSPLMIEPYLDTNQTSRERKRKFYRDIMRRGPQAFDLLVEALLEMGHWDLVRDLDPNTSYQIPESRPTLNPGRSFSHSPSDKFVSISAEKNKTKIEVQKSGLASSPPPAPGNDNEKKSDNNNDTIDENPIPCFVVEKSKKFVDDDDTKDIKLYRTRGRNRGILVVFSYIQFKNNIASYRSGADVDCDKLKYLFSEFGFNVLSYKNLTLEETKDTLKQLKQVLVNVESVFIVVSSHGYERSDTSDTDIRCSDGRLISLYQVIDYFSNRNLPNITDVPKVFIFQICRGSKEEWMLENSPKQPPEMVMPEERVAIDGTPDASGLQRGSRQSEDSASYEQHITRPYSNILIAHSTLPGFVSYRDPEGGSWYIQVLCEVFAERAHDCHVDKLFVLVDERLRDKFNLQTSSIDRWGFNKRLYLHPGLFE